MSKIFNLKLLLARNVRWLVLCSAMGLFFWTSPIGTQESQSVIYQEEDMSKSIQSSKSRVIYLNGPSSAGKSTLARRLQNVLDEPYLCVGIDKIIGMMPQKINRWTTSEDEPTIGYSWISDHDGSIVLNVGHFAQRMEPLLRKMVNTMIAEGHNVIVDDVSFGEEEVDKWRSALQNENVIWVGLQAPVDVLEEREKSRPDRILGSARAQSYVVHRGVQYDLYFDTSITSLDAMVGAIIELLETRE